MWTALTTGALGLFGGAKRWLNGEALKALSFAIVAVSVLIGCCLLYHSGAAPATLAERLACVSGINTANVLNARMLTIKQAAADSAAAAQRDNALGALKVEADRSATLERTIAELKDNPVAYPRDLARSLNK